MLESVIIISVSIIFSAFFSGMEIAFITSSKLHFELEKKQGNLNSSIISRLNKNPSQFITTMLIGNNIALVVYGMFMGELIISILFPYYVNVESYPLWVLLVQTLISTLVILVTAEFMPKAIFRIYSNELLTVFAIPAYIIYILFYFVSSFVVWLSKSALRVFTGENIEEKDLEFRKVDLGNYISEQLEIVDINKDVDVEIQMFQNALEFKDVKARECMIPRTEIVGVEYNDSVEKLNSLFVSSGKSKIIIYKNDIDDIVGYIHSFEMFKRPESVKSMLLPVEFVPETLPVNELLNTLIKKRKMMAIVLDEYGGTSGLVTFEDIVEELFGEIEDEHDIVEMTEQKIDENEYLFAARLEIDHLNETYSLGIEENDDYETIGGFVLYYLQNIPEKNQIIEIGDFEIKITKVSNNKIDELKFVIR
ncbi:MAG: HlyC/CorC family transporter [Flavobacteriales bacterium]|nr:HlyC/CorC family transporter [Flavobacteriales bacterium]